MSAASLFQVFPRVINLLGSAIVLFSIYKTNTKSHSAASKSERVETDETDRNVVWLYPTLRKIFVIFGFLAELLQATSSTFPPPEFPPAINNRLILLIRLFFLAICFSGLILRIACYKHLGRFFTYELAIRKEHKLITSGPYAFVRHPSYTGGYMGIFGALGWFALPGSAMFRWSERVAGQGIVWVAVAILWVLCAAECVALVKKRVRMEDNMLKGEFGREWEEWASRVRWTLVPGVY